MRKADNAAEARLWLALRNRHLNGLKFVRQFAIGPYFADFACRERSLVVEVDGSQHLDNTHDLVRTFALNDLGWSVARFWYADVMRDRDVVLETIAAVCDGTIAERVDSREFQFYPALDIAPHPNPLPASGERGLDGDRVFMRRALRLGFSQLGRTGPNPPVGCVIVRDGEVVGQGATGDGGRPHAEEIALDHAGEKARGATAYVTLEPCGERSNGGRSCGQKLAEAGVARVVYACADPSPFASHKGPQRLAAAEIPYESGLMADECAVLIAGFVHWLDTGRPRVIEAGQGAADADFTADPAADLAAELRVWGDRGFRTVSVPAGSPLAQALRRQGLLSE